MQLSELVALLNEDLKNEWMHMQFYLHHASAVTGLHAHEYKEFLLEQAASEMKHISQFSDLIIGLGGEPTVVANSFLRFTNVYEVLTAAAEMELAVVQNYAERINDVASIPDDTRLVRAQKKWVEIFLEKQLEDSQQDLDHLKQLITRRWVERTVSAEVQESAGWLCREPNGDLTPGYASPQDCFNAGGRVVTFGSPPFKN